MKELVELSSPNREEAIMLEATVPTVFVLIGDTGACRLGGLVGVEGASKSWQVGGMWASSRVRMSGKEWGCRFMPGLDALGAHQLLAPARPSE